MKHLHFKFYAYKEKIGTTLMDGVFVTINDCKNEEEASIKVKEIIKRNLYDLREVWECSTCFIEEEKLANQRYLVAKLDSLIDKDKYE